MKNTKQWLLITILALTGALSSCTADDENNAGTYGDGIYVVNEGSFGTPNGSISYINPETGEITNDIFTLANNGLLLGDVVQSMSVYQGRGFIVVNNSNKVVVVNLINFSVENVIENLALPRHVQFYQNEAYISEWVSFSGSGRISVVNLSTFEVIDTIGLLNLPDEMLVDGSTLWVANSADLFVHRIDMNTNTIIDAIDVGDWPNSLVKGADGNVYVLCGGIPDWSGPETPSTIARVNPTTGEAITVYTFPSLDSEPTDLKVADDGTTFYFLEPDGVYTFSVAGGVSSTPLIAKSAYGFGVHPATGNLYLTDAGNFSAAGSVYWYSAQGSLIDSATAGIAPGAFCFVP